MSQQILQRFRANESAESAYCLISDPEAVRVAFAWSLMPVRFRDPATPPPDDDRYAWEWLWSRCEYSLPELANRANVTQDTAMAKFQMLRGMRLIYPDGTISAWVKSIAKARVARFVRENTSADDKPARPRRPGTA